MKRHKVKPHAVIVKKMRRDGYAAAKIRNLFLPTRFSLARHLIHLSNFLISNFYISEALPTFGFKSIVSVYRPISVHR